MEKKHKNTINKYQDLHEIRKDIDAIDEKIIHLIGDRIQITNAAYQFKSSENDVRAVHRQQKVLDKIKKESEEHNINSDIIIKIYKSLINYCVNNQMETWKKHGKN